LVLPLAYFFIFKYLPISGIILAFRRYVPAGSIYGEEWVGLKYIAYCFNNSQFIRAFVNNLILSGLSLIFTFPAPIIFALLLNEFKDSIFKKVTQIISYLPRFLSMVVVVGMIKAMLSPSTGVVNKILDMLGMNKIVFLNEPEWFRPIFLISEVWQWTGWAAIIYFAALSNIDMQLYESAVTDGAGRWKQTVNITIPSIMPAIIITLILRVGQILEIGFEKVLMLYTPTIYETADIISTFTYRTGIQGANYSLATAVGLTESIIGLVLIVIANAIARKKSDISLW
jgi:putative aldouronate transport system permease protein